MLTRTEKLSRNKLQRLGKSVQFEKKKKASLGQKSNTVNFHVVVFVGAHKHEKSVATRERYESA